MTTDLRYLLAIYVHAHQTGNSVPPHIDAEARAALADEPAAPAPPADGEVVELVVWLEEEAKYQASPPESRPAAASRLTRAAELLQRQALVPVSVAERPWEREGWCDGSDRCWWLVPNQSWPCLYLMKIDSAIAAAAATHCLPAHALPLPEAGE